MQNPTPPVPGYGLKCPAEDEVKAKLTRTLGPDQGLNLWERACTAAGGPGNRPLSVDQLIDAGKFLARQGGIISVYGSSLVVRASSFKLLSRKMQADTLAA